MTRFILVTYIDGSFNRYDPKHWKDLIFAMREAIAGNITVLELEDISGAPTAMRTDLIQDLVLDEPDTRAIQRQIQKDLEDEGGETWRA